VKYDDLLGYGISWKEKLVVRFAVPPVWFPRSGTSFEYDDTRPVLPCGSAFGRLSPIDASPGKTRIEPGRETWRTSKDTEAATWTCMEDMEEKQDRRKRAWRR
jgi:hypothetical protein